MLPGTKVVLAPKLCHLVEPRSKTKRLQDKVLKALVAGLVHAMQAPLPNWPPAVEASHAVPTK